jgi:hypothetical protein
LPSRSAGLWNLAVDTGIKQARSALSLLAICYDMKLIPLTQGKFAKVDDEDYDWLMQWKWCATLSARGTWYARRYEESVCVAMHREIATMVGLPQVDHQDCDGLNNQRYNLRPCTSRQNNQNRRKVSGKSSQYKGVCWITKWSKWSAYIRVNSKLQSLGTFDDEVEAAHAYDNAAVLHFGTFARLNFPVSTCVLV